MRLLVPTHFQSDFLETLGAYPVAHLYGSLPGELGERARTWGPPEEAEQVAEHIARAHSMGIGFVYALNGACTGNMEFTGEGQRWLVETLGWLVEVGADGVMVANPYIVEMTRKRYPELPVRIAPVANVDSVDKVRFYRELGVTAIHLPEYVNRDFRLLKGLARQAGCELAVTVNLACLLRCPLRDYHANFLSHASGGSGKVCHLDYSLAKCTQMKAASPVELIRAPWIRPEDLGRYEELGIQHFQIAGLEQDGEWVLRAVAAYAGRSYAGNLNDLLTVLDTPASFGQPPVHLDNTALDGFLDYFYTSDCRLGCAGCDHCEEWADRAVSREGGEPWQRYLGGTERQLRRFTSGSFRAPLTHP